MSIYPKVYRNREQAEPAAQGQALEDLSYDDLYALAQEQNIHGRSSMSKEDLIAALEG